MSAMCQVLSRCWGQQGEEETSLPQDNLCDTCSHRAWPEDSANYGEGALPGPS